jgi:hypothetical protein
VRQGCKTLSMMFLMSACRERTELSPPAGNTLPAAAAAQAALEKLDARAPVPLSPMMAHHQKQNMREHLASVHAIVAAAAAGDFPGVEQAARTIGYSEQMGRMCSHMGASAPGFTDQALAFHHAADKIGDAARRRDLPGVLGELGTTLAICTGCHAGFKQQVVAEVAFDQSGAAAPGVVHGR